MVAKAPTLPHGEAVVQESADAHFLRPTASLVGRLCHPYLTNSRLILCEAYYDISRMREKGVGGVIHEVALAAVEKVRSGPASGDPSIELDVRNQRKELEKLVLCFRDGGTSAGAPQRLGERDAWIDAIARERENMGLPVPVARAQSAAAAAPSKAAAATKPASDVHKILAGKYELLRQIGSGGMGVVFEGRDHSLDRSVAAKKMRSDAKMAGRDKQLFLQEAKMSASLHHPFIADIYAILEDSDDIYLIFEYLDGQTLQEYLDDKGRMPPPKVKQVLRCVCEALAYAHSCKVVHRDLKPSNIMVTKQGYTKVMDFGIARRIKDTASRLSKTKLDTSGTLPYMAPEQELGRADHRADIFALGATVYELLAGELPFSGPKFYQQKEKREFPPLAELAPEAPLDMSQAVERCLAFKAEDRFQTIEDFAKAIGVG